MKFFRRHPYLITLAFLLVVFPVPAFAVGEEFVYGLVTSVLGLFVRLAATLLNAGVNTFVIGFGDVYATSGVGYAVDTTWIIIRDFVNMGFIFGFIYIGFKMILNSNDSNTRRWLVNLLLAALLVNFSLFATKLVVDFSNQIAAQIVVGGLSGEDSQTNKKTGLIEVDLGQSFLERMGITSVWGNLPGNGSLGYGYIFGTAILFMVTAFVFAAGGILLMIRFAVLNLFLVLSPLMFLSWILPPLKDTMNRYWGMFLGRAFFAPIYFLFIYFSLQIIAGLQVAVGDEKSNLANPNWASTFQAVGDSGISDINQSTTGTLPFFVLICVFMIASLVIAQKMGADGGVKAVALGKSLSNKTQRFAARNTAGYGARALNRVSERTQAGYQRLDARLAQTGLGRFTRGALTVASLGALSDKNVQGALGAGQKVSVAGSETAEQVRKRESERRGRQSNVNDQSDIRTGVSARDRLRTEGDALSEEEKKTLEAQAEKMEKLVGEMGIKEFEAMSEAEQEKIAEHLSGSLTESVGKSDKISDEQKAKIDTAQKKAIESTLESNGEILEEKIASLSIRQIETLGADFINKNAAQFTDSQISDIKKSKKFTEGQVGRFVGKRKSDLNATVGDASTASRAFTQSHLDETTGTVKRKSRKAAEIAKLPGEVLASRNSTEFLTADVLKAIANNDKDFERVSTQQREDILKNLEAHLASSAPIPPGVEKALNYLHSAQGQMRFLGQDPR